MLTSERDLIIQWFEVTAEQNEIYDKLRKAEEVLKLAQARVTNIEQLLYKFVPENSVRRFYIKYNGKLRLIEVHRKSGFGAEGVYEHVVEDLGS